MTDATPLPVLVVDDEEPARRLLAEYLGRSRDYRLVGMAKNGLEAVAFATSLEPALILLDVEMPGLDGFEVLPLLPKKTAVVFVTAYDAFALRAFEVNAVDYLQKPVSEARFNEALRRASERLTREEAGPPAKLRDDLRPVGTFLERIVIRDGAKVEVVPVQDIEYFMAQDDYVEVFFRGRSSLTPETMASLEANLDATRFVRIHRSFLVNLSHLLRVETLGPGKKVAVLSGERRLPISRSGDTRLRAQLGR